MAYQKIQMLYMFIDLYYNIPFSIAKARQSIIKMTP